MFRTSLLLSLCVLVWALGVSACESGADPKDGAPRAGKGGSAAAGSGGSKAPSGCSAETPASSGQTVVQLSHGGRPRSYILYVPQGYDGSRPLPLVLNFHGYTSSATAQLGFSGLGPVADAQGFILALPEGFSASWNSGNCCGDAWTHELEDVAFTRAVVADISSKLCVDGERIYATGMSNGGFFAHRLACDAADVFAAVAPVAGVITLKPEECMPSRPISIMHFHGTADTVVPFTGGGVGATIGVAESMASWVERNGCETTPEETFRQGNARCESYPGCRDGVDVTLCTVEGGGHCWPGNPVCPYGTSTVDLSASNAMWDFMQQYTMP